MLNTLIPASSKNVRIEVTYFLIWVVFCDVRQIAVVFAAVQSVADCEEIGYSEKRVVGLEIHGSALGFVKESEDFERKRVSLAEHLNYLGKRSSRVNDVLNDDNVIFGDIKSSVIFTLPEEERPAP